jgi:8-oxo-dGTP pyrophosphatase MutT (NUDIX family)
MFNDFIKQLRLKLKQPLPGREAQFKMASDIRLTNFQYQSMTDRAIRSGVLVLLFPFGKSIWMVLIKRAIDKSVHSGQISLPGGKYEKEDADLEQTALRETHEEVGVNPSRIKILGNLTELFIPPSNFIVYPFVGYCNEKPVFIPDSNEVDCIIEADINDFLNPINRKLKEIIIRNEFKITTPVFEIQGHSVWGATGMILSEFTEIIREIL